jgi:hypothetical protein
MERMLQSLRKGLSPRVGAQSRELKVSLQRSTPIIRYPLDASKQKGWSDQSIFIEGAVSLAAMSLCKLLVAFRGHRRQNRTPGLRSSEKCTGEGIPDHAGNPGITGFTGTQKVKVAPWSRWLTTSIPPLCARRIALAMARPIPVPCKRRCRLPR